MAGGGGGVCSQRVLGVVLDHCEPNASDESTASDARISTLCWYSVLCIEILLGMHVLRIQPRNPFLGTG